MENNNDVLVTGKTNSGLVNKVSYDYEMVQSQIEFHYKKFQQFYNEDSNFKGLYDKISPLTNVYVSDPSHLKLLFQKLGYSNTTYNKPALQNLIQNNTSDIIADVDAGWFTDYVYYLFKTSGNGSFILCHYHNESSRLISRLFFGSIIVGATYYYFEPAIMSALTVLLSNKETVKGIMKNAYEFGKQINVTDGFLGRFKKYIDGQAIGKPEQQQDIIYACMMFKTNEFWMNNIVIMKSTFPKLVNDNK